MRGIPLRLIAALVTSTFRLAPVLLIAAFGLGGCSRPDPAKAAAELRLLFDKTEQDLGAIRVGAQYSVTYRLTNTTPRPIVVSDIKASCGCMVANYHSSTINPGDFQNIDLKLTTDQQMILGPMVKHAWVRFGGGERVELQLSARLEPEFEVEPRDLVFETGQPERLSLLRKQLDAASFQRLVLVAPPEFYEAVELSPDAAGDHRRFSITLKAQPAGSGLPAISVSDSPAGRPLPYSTVNCSRRGPTLRPSACVFVVGGGTLPAAQRFEIVDPAAHPIQITSVEATDSLARRHVAIKQLDERSFEVSLSSIPEKALTNLQIDVAYQGDDGTDDRLLLGCHIVVAPNP